MQLSPSKEKLVFYAWKLVGILLFLNLKTAFSGKVQSTSQVWVRSGSKSVMYIPDRSTPWGLGQGDLYALSSLTVCTSSCKFSIPLQMAMLESC